MSIATAILIASIVILAAGIGGAAYLIRSRSYRIKNAHFQRALWLAQKRHFERQQQQRAQRRASL